MRPGTGAAPAVFFLLLGTVFRIFPQQFIITDAAEGVFRSDRRLSFTLARPGTLRLLLNSRVIYQGPGPAYPEIGLSPGEERAFTLGAEYYSPPNELLESRSWQIYIDKKPPSVPNMDVRNTADGPRVIAGGGEPAGIPGGLQGAKIRALADIEGALFFSPDVGEARTLPSASFSALVWAEDAAGNCSEPEVRHFDISPVKIENPVPGEWGNRQTLIISGAEGRNVYWTDDGTDPLDPGGAGRLYRGPERVTKEGRVTLRIAWRDSAGRNREDSVAYSVTPGGGNSGLNDFMWAEEKEITSLTAIPLSGEWLWSMGGVPALEGGIGINLRPEPLIKRAAAVHLSPKPSMSSGGSGPGKPAVYRFAYFLNGGGGQSGIQAPPPPEMTREETPLPATGRRGQADSGNMFPPRLVSAGRNRLIVWPDIQEFIYYAWEGIGPGKGGSWREGRRPLPVPLEGGLLQWFVIDAGGASGSGGNGFYGPYSAAIKPLPEKRETPRGRIACRKYNGNGGWELVSGIAVYNPGMVKNRAFDVCDGEDIEWAFISSSGNILETRRRDRLPPPAPLLAAPPDKAWTRGPVTVDVFTGEEGAVGIINARLRYASGRDELLGGTGSLKIASHREERAEVTIECFQVDASGNQSPPVTRYFTLDPMTIYVSPGPIAAHIYPPSEPAGLRIRGGMDDPFHSLDEALDYAFRNNLRDIRIAGKLDIRGPLEISKNIQIGGGIPGDEAALILGDDFYWNINPGAVFSISGLKLERKNGKRPLIQAGRNARLEIAGASIANEGPLLVMEAGVCEIKDSQVSVVIAGEERIAALSADESNIHVSDSRIQLRGDYGLLFNIRGGSLLAERSVFQADGGKTATLINLRGSRADFINLAMSASARDYASAIEAANSELVLDSGTLDISARDSSAVLLDHARAVILDSQILVEGTFSARAAEIRGAFPLVQNSRFYSGGEAGRADVFSGTEVTTPPAGSITGNRFSGFTHIWGNAWPGEKIPDFNRAFASPAKPNRGTL